MKLYVKLVGSPNVWLYRDARELPLLPAQDERHAFLRSVSDVRSSAAEETANVSITLDNSGFKASAVFFTSPPIGQAAEIYGDGALLFVGTVGRVNYAADFYNLDVIA